MINPGTLVVFKTSFNNVIFIKIYLVYRVDETYITLLSFMTHKVKPQIISYSHKEFEKYYGDHNDFIEYMCES